MDKQNDMAQFRYLEEATISLKRAGYGTGQIEDRHLSVSWNDCYLCRISDKGSVLYRQQNVDANGAQAELQNVIDIAKTTSEYMAMMERAPQLKARDLEGDYRVLADFNGIVLAGHPTCYGVRFITWEWDWNSEGVHTGNYFYEHYEEAKRDFATRSGLVQKDALLRRSSSQKSMCAVSAKSRSCDAIRHRLRRGVCNGPYRSVQGKYTRFYERQAKKRGTMKCSSLRLSEMQVNNAFLCLYYKLMNQGLPTLIIFIFPSQIPICLPHHSTPPKMCKAKFYTERRS